MTMSMQATYNAINAATRHLADNSKLPIWPPPQKQCAGLAGISKQHC